MERRERVQKRFVRNGPKAKLAGDKIVEWSKADSGSSRSSAAGIRQVWPDIPPLRGTSVPRVHSGLVPFFGVCSPGIFGIYVHGVGEPTCHLGTLEGTLGIVIVSSASNERGSVIGHRTNLAPSWLNRSISPFPPDLADLSLSHHCHSYLSPDLRSLAGAGEKDPQVEKNVSPAPLPHVSSNEGSTWKIYHVFHFSHSNGVQRHPVGTSAQASSRP